MKSIQSKAFLLQLGIHLGYHLLKLGKLPNYLGVTRDNKFFVELNQVDYDSCPGKNFKQCSNFLRVFQIPEPTCSSALFMNRFEHMQCQV